MKPGKLLILCAPSGGGKSTMAKRLMAEFPQIKFSVSATTRAPRAGEEHGREYYFLTRDEFLMRVKQGDFLEHEEFYNGTLYGTLREQVDKMMISGYFPLLDVDVNGGLNVRSMYPTTSLSIFLRPPSLQILRERLVLRGTESAETLEIRLARAEMELAKASDFDFEIINDELERAYGELRELVERHLLN
jgi:guanylate kinase